MFLFGKKKNEATASQPPVSAGDMAAVPSPTQPPVEGDEPVLRKRRRPTNANKTRLVGFDTSDGRVTDLFGEDKATTDTGRFQFPVGLVMVVKGPGFGECFAIKPGMSQIGRGEGQAIQLDFGDMAVSRENHRGHRL